MEILVELCTKTICPLAFFGWDIFDDRFISLQFIGLFKLLTCSWFNFGICYLSKLFSITFTFSNFVEYRFNMLSFREILIKMTLSSILHLSERLRSKMPERMLVGVKTCKSTLKINIMASHKIWNKSTSGSSYTTAQHITPDTLPYHKDTCSTML